MKHCRICNKKLNYQKYYCSNYCKFSDDEYNKRRAKRIKINDNTKSIRHKKTKKIFHDINNLSGALSKFCKSIGEEFSFDSFEIIDAVKQEYLSCPECSWKTSDLNNKSGQFTIHIRKKHNLSIDDFVGLFPAMKYLWKMHSIKKERDEFINKDEQNRIKCEECGEYFKKLSNSHLKKHRLTPTMYKEKYNIYNTASLYTSSIQSEMTIVHNLKHGSSTHNKTSSLEDHFANLLNEINVKYISPFLFEGKRFDFYIPEIDTVIEIDGEAFHPNKLENLTIQTVNGTINDFQKNKIMQNSNFVFYRIRYRIDDACFDTKSELKRFLRKNSYNPSYEINYTQKVIDRNYFEKFKKYKGDAKLSKYVPLLLKFIRTFHSEFPYLLQRENLTDTIQKISKYDLSRIYDSKSKTFRNNISSLGVNYLKSNFESYWHSSFRDNKTPVDAWNDDEIMKKVVKYRIGLNNSNEVFDFSLHQLIRGLSARRYTISFFKPLLAAAIYKHFLGDIKNPIVIDPCAGFGGRMLGFKSVYPNGEYIGIEPNIDTYNELVKLSKNFSSIQLHNCKLEDYVGNKDCDLTFTSIPYFDKETYSKNVKYNNFKHWKSTFIENLMSYNNLIINLPKDLEELFTNYTEKYFIQNNTSHFNRNQNIKNELLIAI